MGTELAERDRRITQLLKLSLKLDKRIKELKSEKADLKEAVLKKVGQVAPSEYEEFEDLFGGIGECKGVIPFKDTPFGSELIKAVTEKINFLKERVGKVENDTYDIAWDDPKFVVLDKNRQLMIAEIIGMKEVLELLNRKEDKT